MLLIPSITCSGYAQTSCVVNGLTLKFFGSYNSICKIPSHVSNCGELVYSSPVSLAKTNYTVVKQANLLQNMAVLSINGAETMTLLKPFYEADDTVTLSSTLLNSYRHGVTYIDDLDVLKGVNMPTAIVMGDLIDAIEQEIRIGGLNCGDTRISPNPVLDNLRNGLVATTALGLNEGRSA